jgi:hypothetical protein
MTTVTSLMIVPHIQQGECFLNPFFPSLVLISCHPRNTRGERFYNFITRYGADLGDTIDYATGVGHNAAVMMTNTAGVRRIMYVP